MISEIADAPAVFDAEAVRSLTGHPGDREFALVFVGRYRDLLPERVRRIRAGLAAAQTGGEADDETDDETDDLLDAVLSLKVASTTVGAQELAAIATRLEALVRRGRLAQAVVVETLLPGAAERAHRALGAFLGD